MSNVAALLEKATSRSEPDLSRELEQKTEVMIGCRVSRDMRKAIEDEAERLGLRKNEFDTGLAPMMRRMVRFYFASQRFLCYPADHPVIEYLTKARQTAIESFQNDGRFDAVEQREITIPAVRALDALLKETA